MYEIAIIIFAVLIPLSFFFGFFTGKEKTPEPIKAIKKLKRRKKIENNADIEKWNIDNYHGPFSKQRDYK